MLEISTLGGLDIRCDGEPVTGFASRKVEALAVYLACTGRPKAREVLAELLWEEQSQRRSAGNLRVALSSLRKLLGPYYIITRDMVSMDPEAPVWLDVSQMEQPLSTARGQPGAAMPPTAAQLEESVGLYRGDFLEGFYVRDCYGFENWMVLERERVRALYEQNLQALLDALLASGRWPDVIEWAERWIAQGQIPEPAYRALMNAYGGQGDLGSVAAVYQRCVESLRLQLGVEPSAQTRETYEHLAEGGQPEVVDRLPPAELQAPTADSAARMLLRQWRQRGDQVLDIASLAVVYASRADLGIGPEEAELLIRSALHHSVDVEPWLRRVGSPHDAVQALTASLDRYPRPGVRLQIVEALQGLESEEADDVLVRIALSDDSSEVRTEAALAAAEGGRLEEVRRGLVADLGYGDEGAPLAALVAVADEYGLPERAGSYPRTPVLMALAQRRWRGKRRAVAGQALRAGWGAGLAWVFHASLGPLYLALAYPDQFRQITPNLVALPAWILVNGLMGLVVGGLLGSASGFGVGLADALWKGSGRTRWRLVFGGLAGLVHSAYLILFSATGAFQPAAPPLLYVPVDILYGILQGLIVAFVIPPLGTNSPFRRQLIRSLWAGLASVLVTIPYVYLVYLDEAGVSLFSRLLGASLLPFGIGLALSRSAPERVRHSDRKGLATASDSAD